jgi:hypothetical protein
VVYSRAERMFIPEYYLESKSLTVRKSFSNVYPDKEVLIKTIHRLVTTFLDIELFACDKCLLSGVKAHIPISSSASAATTGYGCNSLILPLVSLFCA